jgi:hypothetical protein
MFSRISIDPRICHGQAFTEYRAAEHSGILIVRLRQPNRWKIHRAVMLALARFQESEWPALLLVVRDTTLSVSRGGGRIEKPWRIKPAVRRAAV